jgi:hypothetical protein
MDPVPTDFKELLECFNAHEIDYLVVGAYALAFHGAPRATGDIDVLVRPEVGNARKVLDALADFGFTSLGLGPQELAVPDQVVQLGVVPVRVDILTSLSGVSWQEAWEGRQQGSIGGIPVFFIGRDAYIANKRAAGRLRDLADVEALGESPGTPPDGADNPREQQMQKR